MLGSCTYMGMQTNRRSLCCSSCRAPVLQPAGSEVFSCACSVRQRARDELLPLAVVLRQSICQSFGYQWGWMREFSGRRWGQMRSGLQHELRSQSISTRCLPSASSSQTCIGRFFSWFYLARTYIDGDIFSPLRSRSQEMLNILEAPFNIIRLLKAFKTFSEWSELEPAWTMAWNFYGQIPRTWVGLPYAECDPWFMANAIG